MVGSIVGALLLLGLLGLLFKKRRQQKERDAVGDMMSGGRVDPYGDGSGSGMAQARYEDDPSGSAAPMMGKGGSGRY